MKGVRVTRGSLLLPWVFPDVTAAAEWVKRMRKTAEELNVPNAEYRMIFEEDSG